MRKMLRSIARANMQKAGFAKINKPVGSDKKSFFAANWRNYVY